MNQTAVPIGGAEHREGEKKWLIGKKMEDLAKKPCVRQRLTGEHVENLKITLDQKKSKARSSSGDAAKNSFGVDWRNT